MGATAAITIGVGSAIYQGVQANQDRQRAKGQAAAILRQRPDANALQQQANTASLDAQAKQRKKTAAIGTQGGTLLTGPQGVTAPPPATRTLLGQ